MVDDPQVGQWRRYIDPSIGAAEKGSVGMFKLSRC